MTDTLSVRDQVYDRIEDILAAIDGYAHFRLPNADIQPEDMPALVMIDGGEDIGEMLSGQMGLLWRFTVVVAVTHPDGGRALARAINAGRAAVRLALGRDPILGGLASLSRYDGADDPVVINATGTTPPYAAMATLWVIEGSEGELDPFVQGNL